MANFDIFDQGALTRVINHSLETRIETSRPSIGQSIAPIVQIQDTEVSVEVNDVEAFGKGQFRAPDATPPLVDFSATRRQEVIELALLDEMHRIRESDYKKLTSGDAAVRRSAGVSLVDRGAALAIRNRRLLESMIWDAFDGTSTITYPSGSVVTIDYGFKASHKPQAAVSWDNPSADIITELKAWQALSANDLGEYGLNIYMSTETWENILKNNLIKAYLTGSDRGLFLPTREDVLQLLRDGTTITITDAGYRDTGVGIARGVNTLTRYLPQGYILITTTPNIDGERIAETIQGTVTLSSSYNSTVELPGQQSEVILDHISKNRFLRYASSNIVRINHPDAFVWAQVTY